MRGVPEINPKQSSISAVWGSNIERPHHRLRSDLLLYLLMCSALSVLLHRAVAILTLQGGACLLARMLTY